MGSFPEYREDDDIRLRRLCWALYYSRHRFNTLAVSGIIDDILVHLSTPRSFDPLAVFELALQIIALLDESARLSEARSWLEFVDTVLMKEFGRMLTGPDAPRPFVLARWKAQVFYHENPVHDRGRYLIDRAKELRLLPGDSVALTNITTNRLLLHDTRREAYRAWETISTDLEKYLDATANRGRARLNISGADLAELFAVSALVAFRVFPTDPEMAEEYIDIGKRLFSESGEKIAQRYWQRLVELTAKQSAKPIRGIVLPDRYLRPPLPAKAIAKIELILHILMRTFA